MYVIRGNTYAVKEQLKKESNIGLQWDGDNKVWVCESTFPLDRQCYKKANISFEDVGDEIKPRKSPKENLHSLIEHYSGLDTVSAKSVVEDLQFVLTESDWFKR